MIFILFFNPLYSSFRCYHAILLTLYEQLINFLCYIVIGKMNLMADKWDVDHNLKGLFSFLNSLTTGHQVANSIAFYRQLRLFLSFLDFVTHKFRRSCDGNGKNIVCS